MPEFIGKFAEYFNGGYWAAHKGGCIEGWRFAWTRPPQSIMFSEKRSSCIGQFAIFVILAFTNPNHSFLSGMFNAGRSILINIFCSCLCDLAISRDLPNLWPALWDQRNAGSNSAHCKPAFIGEITKARIIQKGETIKYERSILLSKRTVQKWFKNEKASLLCSRKKNWSLLKGKI